MQTSIWPNKAESLEARANRIGTSVSLITMCVALILIGLWLVSTPSFEKCSALGKQSERAVCFESLRDGQMKSPAKGGISPALNNLN